MVECEYFAKAIRKYQKEVLIDTWWNVNVVAEPKTESEPTVLIDTWWNVNILDLLNPIINLIVLIDTWWNVNAQQKSLSFQFWRF